MSLVDDALGRFASGYYNSLPSSPTNPGGLGGYGHVTNFEKALLDIQIVVGFLKPAALQILGVAQYAGNAAASAADAEASFLAAKAKAEFFRSLTVAELLKFADNAKFMGAAALIGAMESKPLAWSATLTPNMDDGLSRHVVLTGHTVQAMPTNLKAGHGGRWRYVQNAAGGNTLSFAVGFKAPGGDDDISLAANAITTVAYYAHAPNEVEINVVRGYI